MRSIVKAIIRIILVFLFVEMLLAFIRYGGIIWSSTSRYSDWDIYPEILILIGAQAIAFLVLWILWWKTDWLVRFLVRKAPDDSLVITTSNLDLFIVALRILGIFLIVTAVADLVGHISYYLSFDKTYPEAIRSQVNNDLIRNLSVSITTLIIGLVLAFSGSKLFNPLRNLWSTGSLTGKKSDSEDS